MTGQGRDDDLLNYGTAKELVAALAARTISSLELTDHVIARIEKFDGKLNAVIARDFDRARDAARSADAALARGERRPLLGIPMTIKESFDIVGLRTTWGVPDFKDFVPREDALAVARVKAAGAIILGKTNVPFLLGDWQSYNDIYGTTNSPWDIGRTPGRIVWRFVGCPCRRLRAIVARLGYRRLAARAGALLRRLRSQADAKSGPPRGHRIPGTVQRVSDLAVVGPMARSAEDLDLALEITAGPDQARDGIAYRLALPAPRHERLRDFRVLVIDDHPLLPTARAVRAALDRLSQQLVKSGVKVAHTSPLLPDLAESGRLYMRLLMSALSERWPQEIYAQAANRGRSF